MAAQIMDVIVIGCGASGIAALRKLHDAGLKVLGLEAEDRIGGRIKTVPYGDCYLDLGAAWCHGEKDNAVFELANPLGLLEHPQPDHKWYVLSNGELLRSDVSEGILTALDEEVAKADKNTKQSISECVRKAAKSNPTLKKDPKLSQAFVEWFEKTNHVGGQTDPLKGKSLKNLEEHWICEGEFILNWKGRVYGTILDVLLNKCPDPSKELPIQIHFNKEVETIKWCSSQAGNPLVHVKCKDGSLYSAKSVIVTVSLGLLKERHNKLFNPQLPAEKINAINNLEVCVLDKIYIEFTKPWWPETPASFSILWQEQDKAKFTKDEQWITGIASLSTVEYHPNLLLACLHGNAAEKMEQLTVEEVKLGVEKLLNVVFKKSFDVSPVKFITRTEWASNPIARGSYSYRSVVTEEKGGSAIILSEPLYYEGNFPIVCFAGEATSHHRYTAVHGAVESGFREADRLIASLKK
ncbi:peroxisomal N(1)-acetyl-spermine/spermidine oxidase-like isoform X1 [Colias croceus]|uniref:peroxisomal N(1)-acetyl-spermine/spermidine oxidase-like isoform X1 n=2 Tax=Colias crocea TaxID=72248 RepID=UPI001E27C287|nr:peroxisomal N(1)-acetyl-spermine/spermidine oxidase-like isoform X1 [Colias croceus]